MKRVFTVFVIGLFALWSGSSLAQPPVNLGTASNFAVLAGSAVTNTGFSIVNGDLGLSPGTDVSGFPPGIVNGTQHVADAVALQAQSDLVTAYNDAAGRPLDMTVATELGGTTLTPGVYNSASGTFGITGILTLDAQGDPNGVFIFQMATTLVTALSSQVVLIGGAQACNVFWQVGSSATLGTYSSFIGDILALSSITVTTGTVVDGRALARNAAVTLDTDTITVANCASACIPDQQVTLVPNNPDFPGPQDVRACAHLAAGSFTQVVVPVNNVHNVPIVSITPGCPDCGDNTCEPLSNWVLGNWTFVSNPPEYVAALTAAAGATGCCVCLHLDFVLPVELNSFTAVSGDRSVTLSWATASETNHDYFELLRDHAKIAEIDGQGSTTSGASYTWTDNGLTNGTAYTYSLVAVDINGGRASLRTIEATPTAQIVITEYALHQNYPNPFNPTTSITFDLVDGGMVTLKVYNVVGQEVATLVNGSMASGRHTVSFDATGMPSGLYIYRLEATGFVSQHKMLLMK